jgi:antitoxin component of MazEF toxin-antitoxin module
MQTKIRAVGNSKGIIIPANFLEQTGIIDSVDIGVNNKSIVITPTKKQLRVGWFDECKNNENDVDFWQDFEDNAVENMDLVW